MKASSAPLYPRRNSLSKKQVQKRTEKKKGGARIGHQGHGRKSHEADTIISLEGPTVCPECGRELVVVEMRDRAVIESTPTKPKRLPYRLPHARCKRCKKLFRTNLSGVLPKSLYGNQLIAQFAVMHYYHGIPMGRISEMTGVNVGSIV
jgi:transposase